MSPSVRKDKHDMTPSSACARGDYLRKRPCVMSFAGSQEGADVEAGFERVLRSFGREERGRCIEPQEREDT